MISCVVQKFILPASPWWGGFYERLVRSVKLSLRKVLSTSFVSFEELQTILCEVEQIINGRALVYISECDLEDDLTPFHLMLGRDISLSKRYRSDPVINQCDKSSCIKIVNYLATRVDQFWKPFSSVNLNELCLHQIYNKINGKQNVSQLKIGEVVLIRDDSHLQHCPWRKGKV